MVSGPKQYIVVLFILLLSSPPLHLMEMPGNEMVREK